MFNKNLVHKIELLERQLRYEKAFQNSVSNSMATIEFEPDGTIVDANDSFLSVVGYSRSEIIGQHHKIFCEPSYVSTAEYQEFWRSLGKGTASSGTFQRLAKSGDQIWLEASYSPIIVDNVVERIVKIALDVTKNATTRMTQAAKLQALDRSLATIEFTPQGEIITANDNFLNTMGYPLSEIVGGHHRMFCDEAFYDNNPKFWESLANGAHRAGRFERVKKNGEHVWLEATYNPVLDESGRVTSIVKFASDIHD